MRGHCVPEARETLRWVTVFIEELLSTRRAEAAGRRMWRPLVCGAGRELLPCVVPPQAWAGGGLVRLQQVSSAGAGKRPQCLGSCGARTPGERGGGGCLRVSLQHRTSSSCVFGGHGPSSVSAGLSLLEASEEDPSQTLSPALSPALVAASSPWCCGPSFPSLPTPSRGGPLLSHKGARAVPPEPLLQPAPQACAAWARSLPPAGAGSEVWVDSPLGHHVRGWRDIALAQT